MSNHTINSILTAFYTISNSIRMKTTDNYFFVGQVLTAIEQTGESNSVTAIVKSVNEYIVIISFCGINMRCKPEFKKSDLVLYPMGKYKKCIVFYARHDPKDRYMKNI